MVPGKIDVTFLKSNAITCLIIMFNTVLYETTMAYLNFKILASTLTRLDFK